jgi:Uncharacterized conserved protein
MPRSPNEKMIEAEKMFHNGIAMVEIARKLGVSDGTVRSWKNRHDWGDKSKKPNATLRKKTGEKSATLQKRKRGGQPGNQNSKGASKGKGNPRPVSPPDMTRHGGYAPVFKDALDEEEQELLDAVPEDEELLLMEQIQLFSIRERRILKAINQCRGQKGNVVVSSVARMEQKRSFKNEEEEAEYDRRQKKKVDNGDILPGKSYGIQTNTTNKDLIIARLEQELSTVQGKKTKAIEALTKYRLEKAKMNSESSGNDVVKAWGERLLEQRRKQDAE